MEELFIASATKEGLATVTNEVTVKVVKKDSNWKVVAEDELVDAMFGGLIAAAQAIEDSFNDIE
jgi:hypothetical protein